MEISETKYIEKNTEELFNNLNYSTLNEIDLSVNLGHKYSKEITGIVDAISFSIASLEDFNSGLQYVCRTLKVKLDMKLKPFDPNQFVNIIINKDNLTKNKIHELVKQQDIPMFLSKIETMEFKLGSLLIGENKKPNDYILALDKDICNYKESIMLLTMTNFKHFYFNQIENKYSELVKVSLVLGILIQNQRIGLMDIINKRW